MPGDVLGAFDSQHVCFLVAMVAFSFKRDEQMERMLDAAGGAGVCSHFALTMLGHK